jgi:hypothetical protein
MAGQDNRRTLFLWVASHWDAISTISKIVITAVGGGVTGWAARATDLFAAAAPFSWVMAGLGGAAVTALMLAALAWFRAERIRAAFLRDASRSSIEFNPLEDQITRRRFALSDIISPDGSPITNKTFVRCELVGPGAIFFATLNAHNPTFANCEAIKMTGNDVLNLPNKATFVDCIFRDCKFINTVILIPDPNFQQMKALFGDGIKWL